MRLRRALILALASAALACSEGAPRDLEARHADAVRELRAGRLEPALRLSRESGATDDLAWRERFRLLEAEILLYQRQVDEAAARLAAPVAAGADTPALEARRAFLQALQSAMTGTLQDGPARLASVADRARQAGAEPTALDADTMRGQMLARGGRAGEADALLRETRRRAAGIGDAYRELAALNNLGMSRFTRQRFDEALEFFEPVLSLDQVDGTSYFASVLHNAGISHARLGNFDEAIALQSRAVAFHEQGGVPVFLGQALGELGSTHLLAGDAERGIDYMRRAFDIVSGAGLSREAALWAGNLASASVALGRWDDAARFNDEAIRLKTALKVQTLVYNEQTAARIAAGRGRLADARAGYERVLATPSLDPSVAWEAHAGLASVLFATGDRTRAIREFDRALDVIERTRADLLRTEQQFFFPSRLRHFYDEYVQALVDAGLDDAALEVADASHAQVLADRQGVNAGRRQRATAFRAMASASGSTLLSFWLGPTRSFAWVTTGAGTTRVDLPPAREIERLVDRYRAEVERSLVNPLAGPTGSGDALTSAVLQPVLPLLNGRAQGSGAAAADPWVVVVPDGALHGINLEMLPVGSPRRYWIEDVTLQVAPSLGILAARRGAPDVGRGLLIIGDPVPPSPDLAPLAHAGAELDAIAETRPKATQLRRAEATPDAYLRAPLGDFGVIHFAAHATVSPSSPLESAIELSPGPGGYKLYARDVAALSLRAELVTISACRSAGARAFASEGLVGFAWAFLNAGARHVVAGLWDVDDRSTSALMASFHRHVLSDGMSVADGLRQAKLGLIRGGGNFAKPYYWAPFQVFASVPRPAVHGRR